jgi:hypothetical protein
MARVTSTATGRMTQPNALLHLDQPELNMPPARGHVDVDLPFAVRRDGVFRLGQAVFATGEAEIRETGTTCGHDPVDGTPVVVPSPDSTRSEPVNGLLGQNHTVGVIDGFDRFDGRLGPSGLHVIVDSPVPYLSQRTDVEESGTARLQIDLQLSGAPKSHGASCTLPSHRVLRRTRTLPAAQRLLRRHGIPRSPYGGARRDDSPRGSFFLRWSSDTAQCGDPLGSRGRPVLFRSLGLHR